MPHAEMKIYSCIHGTHGKHGLVQNSAGFSKQITVRSDSGVMSDSHTERLGVKPLQDESGCQISTNFKLTAALHLSPTSPANNALINIGGTPRF